MANQIIIDIGAVANDGTGDPLRTAFNYVNNNFSNIWATGVANSNIAFSGNKILTTNTNGNLVLAPNGIGKVQANVDIVPNANNTLNLGSLTNKWNTVYTQYLEIGGTLTTGDLTVDGNLTVSGNIIQIGNLVTDAKTIQLSNTAPNATAANGSGITVGANDDIATLLYNSTGNVWTTNIGITATGNITGTYFIGNGSQLTGITSYSNTNATSLLASFGSNTISTTGNITAGYFIGNGSQLTGLPAGYANANVVAYGQAGWAGNIIPATSNVYSLGNSTNQWSDLYVSNATIYMNNVPISLTAGNVLTVNGEDVVVTNANSQANIGNLDINGATIALVSGASQTLIEISPNGEGWAYLQIPNDATANVANVRMHNDAGNIEIAAGDTSRGGDVYYWYFDNTGTLTVPGDITCNDTFAISSGDDINISGGDKVPGSASSEGGDVTIFGGTGRPDNGTSTGSGGDVRINAGDGGDGTLSGAGVGGYAEVQGGSGGAANVVNNIQAGEGGFVVIQGGSGGDNLGNIALSGIGGNVDIYGGSGSFDDGNSTISGAPGHVNLYGGNWGFVTPSGNIYLNTYDGSNFKTLTYDNVGNVTMAPGGGLNFVGSNPGIVQSPDEDFKIRVQDADDDGFALIQQVDDGSGNVLGSTELQRDLFTIAFAGGSAPQFRFNEAGQTEIPGNIRATEYVDTSLYSVSNDGGAGTVELKVISYAGDVLGSNVRVSQSNATISTNNAQYNWNFDNVGNLNLPLNGNIVGTTPNNNGYLNWFGNSSGDNNGYTTLRLVPDDTLEGNDQYLIIDPTAPGHIHIRAGGTQDNSGAELILGGENSHFRVDNGSNPNVYIKANNYNWTFGTDGNITLPGNSTVGVPAAVGGARGYSIDIRAGAADQGDYYTTPGGDVNITGGLGATNDGGGGGHGGNVNITAGLSADPAGVAGNVTIGSGTNYWQFNNNGNLQVPGSINGDNNGPLIIDGNGSGIEGYISLPASNFGGEQIAIVNEFTLGNGISLVTNGGEWHFGNSGAFTAPGNITTTANISGGYILGNAAFMTGIPASYGNANVADFLDSLGSNAIVTTGNISGGNLLASGYANITGNINGSGATFSGNVTAANFSGNISITGNVTGTSPNVSLVAGSYTYTFDNTGVLSLPAVGGNEGGEINFAIPTANTTLTGPVKVDVYQDRLRFFDGSTNGAYLDLANCPSGVSTAIGYRDIPQISFSANATATGNAAGCHYYSTTVGNLQLTIPDNANVAFPTGATLTIVMNAAGNVIVAQGTGVNLYMAGSSTTGNRTVGAYGLASVMKVATDTWVISGTGVY